MHAPGFVIIGLWIVWALSWLAAAAWSRRPAAKAGLGRELVYRSVIGIGGLVLAWPDRGRLAYFHRMWPMTLTWAWICVALIAAGFIFTWWARLHLGALWSGSVTRKEGHHIVDTGPYGIVRHPIYTGIIFALVFTVVAKGTLPAVVGLALMIAGFVLKARLEERFLREQLGAAEYDVYAARVPMLVPFWK